MGKHISAAIIFTLILSGCATPKDRLLKNIISVAHKEHNIRHGELLAKYNLTGFSGQNTCLFAKDYGDIVNNETHNAAFIRSLNKTAKNKDLIYGKAGYKAKAIYEKISAIGQKYAVVSSLELKRIKHSSKPINPDHIHLEHLAKIDHIIRYIPISLPKTTPLLTSKFGNRHHPKHKKHKFHAGIDLASSKNAAVYAAADGKVIEVAASQSYGNFIVIDHGGIFKTRYAHLSKLSVATGERVFRSQMLGKQGSTGHSTNDHLHFEILYKNHAVDPMEFVGTEYHCRKV